MYELFTRPALPKLPVLLAVVDRLLDCGSGREDKDSPLDEFDELWMRALEATSAEQYASEATPSAASGRRGHDRLTGLPQREPLYWLWTPLC